MTSSAPIVHFLYEPGNGGLDRVAILLANGMARRGISTELWLTKATGPVAHLIAADVKVRMVPSPRFGGRGIRLFLQIPAVARMIRQHQPKAIFSAGNQTNLSLAIAKKIAGDSPTKILQKITNPVLRPSFGKWTKIYRTWRFGLTARLGDLSLTLSAADAEKYAEIYPHAAGKFHSVPNPYVTPEMLSSGEMRKPRDPATATRLLAVGRIAPQKGYLTLLSALALIADRPWSMTILGDGPLVEDVKRRAKKLGLIERIKFVGFVADVTPYFAQSDILVLSSQWEGFPAVPIEAMATGCAVVATDCSDGLTRMLHQIGQDTVPVQDPEALAKAIRDEIDSPRPIEPLRACAAAYSIENSVDQHLKLMEQVCLSS
jgi:glycosyltransferase involved in cell wall biosynthesis